MKFNCFYEVTVIKRVPESINFFEDEEIWYLGYYPYNMVLKEVKQFYEDGADKVKLRKITEKEFNKGEKNQWKNKLNLSQIKKIENNLKEEMKILRYI